MAIKLPPKVSYEICKEWLHKFYNIFKWNTEEKRFKSEVQLDYFATLMNKWINGSPLNQIISESIVYFNVSGRTIMTDYGQKGKKF